MTCGDFSGITIIRGDDSDAFENSIEIEIDTDLDLTGCSAILQVANLKWSFEDITSKVLVWVISKEESLRLKEGVESASMKIFDANGKAMTVITSFPVYIEPQVVDNER